MGKKWQKKVGFAIALLLTLLAFLALWISLEKPKTSFRDLLLEEKLYLEGLLLRGKASSQDAERLSRLEEYYENLDGALKAMRQAVILAIAEQRPEEEIYRLQRELARLLAEAGDKKGAMILLSSLKQKHPHKAGAYNTQGNIHLKEKKTKLAQSEFQKGVRADRKDPESYENLARLEERNKNYRKAKSFLEKAIQESPDHPQGYLAMGDFLMRQGKTKDALRYYRKAYEKDRSIRSAEKLAQALEKDGAYDESARLWEEILKKDPKNAKALWAKARSLRRQGDHKTSQQYYEEALSYDSRNEALRKDYQNLPTEEVGPKSSEEKVATEKS